MTCIEKRRVAWFAEVFTVRRNGNARERYNEDPSRVVWSWFVCKEKKRLFTYSGHDGRESVVAVDEEEVVIEGECWMRV